MYPKPFLQARSTEGGDARTAKPTPPIPSRCEAPHRARHDKQPPFAHRLSPWQWPRHDAQVPAWEDSQQDRRAALRRIVVGSRHRSMLSSSSDEREIIRGGARQHDPGHPPGISTGQDRRYFRLCESSPKDSPRTQPHIPAAIPGPIPKHRRNDAPHRT